jgi:HEAT repeat protein
MGRQSLIRWRWPTEDARRHRAVNAFRVLGPAGAPAIPALTALLEQTPDNPCVILALSSVGAEVPPILITHLGNPDVTVRRRVAADLVFFEQRAAPAVPALLAALQDPDPPVRAHSVATLSRVAKPAQVLTPLTLSLDDPNEVVRVAALTGLSRLRAEARPAVPVLLGLLRDPQPEVRRMAAVALRAIDPETAAQAGVK